MVSGLKATTIPLAQAGWEWPIFVGKTIPLPCSIFDSATTDAVFKAFAKYARKSSTELPVDNDAVVALVVLIIFPHSAEQGT